MKYEPITVTKLNQYIKSKIDTDEYLNNVLVKGEISNFKHHYTGHMYFTLKDENSLIKCVMFKGYTACINSLESYYTTNMDLLKNNVSNELFFGSNQIYTKAITILQSVLLFVLITLYMKNKIYSILQNQSVKNIEIFKGGFYGL